MREALHVSEGDTLLYLVDGEQVRLTTRRQLAQELYGSLAEDDGRDFTDELSAERQAEAQREKP
ncbi:AbrB/MazE/SpoVT family DNA-binding domain-containing protein (plasmid) [Deinococcus altitudinis]